MRRSINNSNCGDFRIEIPFFTISKTFSIFSVFVIRIALHRNVDYCMQFLLLARWHCRLLNLIQSANELMGNTIRKLTTTNTLLKEVNNAIHCLPQIRSFYGQLNVRFDGCRDLFNFNSTNRPNGTANRIALNWKKMEEYKLIEDAVISFICVNQFEAKTSFKIISLSKFYRIFQQNHFQFHPV